MFKDMKDTLAATPGLINQAGQMQQNAMGAQAAANQPVDLNDPMWAPIEGITLDKYAQLMAALTRQSLGAQAEDWLETQGVAKGTWAAVSQGWSERMAAYMAVSTRYGILFAQS